MRKKNFLLFYFLTIWNGNVMLCVLIYYYDVSSNENFYFHLQSQPLCSVYAQYRTSHTQIEFGRSSNRSSGKKKSKKGIDGIEEERLYEIFLLFLQTTAGKVFYLLNFLSIFDDFSNCTAISLKTAHPTLEKH